MTEPKQKFTHASSVQRSFDEGARAGQQFGAIFAPYVLMALTLLAGWIAYRVARWFLRATH